MDLGNLIKKHNGKPYNGNKNINYYSYHPRNIKANTLSAMKSRALKLSKPDEVLRIVKIIFIENSYPSGLVNGILFNSNCDPMSIINTLNENLPNINSRMADDTDTSKKFATIAYISEFNPKFTRVFKDNNIKLAKRSIKTMSQLYSKPKPSLSTMQSYDIVNSISKNMS